MIFDTIIVGAGPAGLMAAASINKNKNILLIEKNNTPGKKLLITGGGRCNLTNLKTNNEFLNEVDYNKKYLYSAINKFGPYDIYNFFEERGVPLKIEEEDKVFPRSNKSVDILNVLLNETDHLKINYNEEVIKIVYSEIKEIITNKSTYRAKNIIIATGGSSYPTTGSNGDNIKFAKTLNQPTTKLFPAETGIILAKPFPIPGTALEEVIISFEKRKSTGNLMFTHQGLSGSSIMKLSEFIYKSNNMIINLDLIPNITEDEIINLLEEYREKEVSTFLNNFFTKKLSLYLTEKINLNKIIKTLTKQEIIVLIDTLKNLKLDIKAVNDLKTAYVTGGGIDLNYINSSTMESTINKGIYFVGEALDIHGPIGGYNITLALSTGFLAGISINKQ